ncbi:MAG: hypothetical protein M9899_07775 [Bdellovibrionaceae bacterium]|nr:hypothetical protein [Pseudobdellovibrionaceae bacterium]
MSSIFLTLKVVYIIWLLITIFGFLYLTRGFSLNERYNSLRNKPQKSLVDKYGLRKVKDIRNFMYFMFFFNGSSYDFLSIHNGFFQLGVDRVS